MRRPTSYDGINVFLLNHSHNKGASCTIMSVVTCRVSRDCGREYGRWSVEHAKGCRKENEQRQGRYGVKKK